MARLSQTITYLANNGTRTSSSESNLEQLRERTRELYTFVNSFPLTNQSSSLPSSGTSRFQNQLFVPSTMSSSMILNPHFTLPSPRNDPPSLQTPSSTERFRLGNTQPESSQSVFLPTSSVSTAPTRVNTKSCPSFMSINHITCNNPDTSNTLYLRQATSCSSSSSISSFPSSPPSFVSKEEKPSSPVSRNGKISSLLSSSPVSFHDDSSRSCYDSGENSHSPTKEERSFSPSSTLENGTRMNNQNVEYANIKNRTRRHRKSKHKKKSTKTSQRVCSWCCCSDTPEWRSGPYSATLCNACGLQYQNDRKKSKKKTSIAHLLNPVEEEPKEAQ